MTRKVLSYTQIKTWKRCRQKWFYRYVRGLVPKERVKKIELGNYGHALLEAHYRGEDLSEVSNKYWLEQTENMFQEEMLEFEEVRQQAEQLVGCYIKHYGKEEPWKIYAVEEHFTTNIPTPKGNKSQSALQGVLDLVVEDGTNEIWLVDHKFTSIDLDKYEENLVLDEQANYYLWALAEMLNNHSAVAGIIFNLVRTKLPTVPQLLKKGGLSKAKNIDTDVETYLQAIKDNKLNPKDYADFLTHVRDNEKPFFKRHYVHRTPEEIAEVGAELYEISRDMRGCRVFRNATKDCSWDCPYRELCIMEYKGVKDDFYIDANFTKNEG
ncbi:MAG: PD-(D/E)XK nuclease family protein [bacterium]|nr:PD-(D/E)XK nuclease family protein [bacterium]